MAIKAVRQAPEERIPQERLRAVARVVEEAARRLGRCIDVVALERFDAAEITRRTDAAKENIGGELERFARNTLEYVDRALEPALEVETRVHRRAHGVVEDLPPRLVEIGRAHV